MAPARWRATIRAVFEAAELGRRVGKKEFENAVETLRLELLEAQRALQKARVPVILLLAGADGAGKGETVKRLLEWLDTRGLDTHAFGPPTDEEKERPLWWRYWMRLPRRGRIGIFFGSWYSEPLVERAFGRFSRSRYDSALSEIAIFEQMLAEDGALILIVEPTVFSQVGFCVGSKSSYIRQPAAVQSRTLSIRSEVLRLELLYLQRNILA